MNSSGEEKKLLSIDEELELIKGNMKLETNENMNEDKKKKTRSPKAPKKSKISN